MTPVEIVGSFRKSTRPGGALIGLEDNFTSGETWVERENHEDFENQHGLREL